MIRYTKLALMFALIAIIGIGCSQGPESLTSTTTTPAVTEKLAIPAGSSLVSATLNIYAESAPGGTIDVHRITDPWNELTVTWNSFAGAYDATVYGSFNADAIGWKSVDVTTLVQAWLDGTYENYGFHLSKETVVTLMTSSEAPSNRPYLTLGYSDGGPTQYTTIERGTYGTVADAYIWSGSPNEPYGNREWLYAGMQDVSEKQALLMFDMDYVPCTACLGDTVWYDDNKDGIQDANELGVPDVSVELYDCTGELLATTTTDANGFYSFCELPEGSYQVKFIAPEGYVFTLQNVGDDADDSDADGNGLTGCYVLGCEDNPTIDAGIYLREMGGCSLTIGFWKTHAGFGPQDDVVSQYLPISLGSFVVNDAATAVMVLSMDQCEGPKNGIVKLMAQYLGAKLNEASGADVSVLADEIADAEAFLMTHDCTDWGTLTKDEQKWVNNLMSTFDDYNNGLIGPGHCDCDCDPK